MSTDAFARRVELRAMDLLFGVLVPKQRVRNGEVVLGTMGEKARFLWTAAIRARQASGEADAERAARKFSAHLSGVYPDLARYKDFAIRRGWKVVGIGKKRKKRSR